MTREEHAGLGSAWPNTMALRFRKTAVMATWVTAIIALAGLLGYLPGLKVLGSILPDYIPMAPTTAGCLFLYATTLFIQLRKPLQGVSRVIICALVALGILFCILALLELPAGVDLNFDDELFQAPKLGTIPIGIISPFTAATFVLDGVGILLFIFMEQGSPLRRRRDGAALLGAFSSLVGATVLLAYLYGSPLMYGGSTIPMAATTALAILFLGVALVAATGPESFPACRVIGASTSALLSRAFLPLTLASIVLQSALSRFVSAAPQVNGALVLAAQVIVMVVITASVVHRVARSTGKNLDEIDGKLREALQEKHESEEHHRTILQAAMDGFWLLDTGGQILEANDAYCRMSGYRSEELPGMKVSDLECIESVAEVQEHIRSIMARGEDRFVSRHRRKDGTVFDAESTVQYRPAKGGQLVVFIRDITERMVAEGKLKESRKQYHDLVEGTADLITRVDTEGRLLFVNHAAGEVYGLAPQECLGRPAFDFIHPEDRDGTMAAFGSWLENGEGTFIHENRQVAVDGREHCLAWSIRPETDEKGAVVGFASTARDITYRRKAEAEKERLEAQLLQAMKMESVGSLAGGVAHDFNNKLTVIIGHACLALIERDPDKIRSSLEEIRSAAEQSADLTRQLLAFARKQTIAPKVLDLNETVARTLKMLQRLIGEDIHLAWQPAADIWLLKLDPSQVDQILTNLCVNARDSIEGVGKITIETGNLVLDQQYCDHHAEVTPGEYVRLAVSDNGCGMGKETLNRIFEPFFTTKETGKGTGLGLSTVFGIVKQNKGFIYVYSEPGQGTTFTIYLPRHEGRSLPSAASGPELPAPRGQETVLVVEDELAILNMITQVLTGLGYSVLRANSPAEAIRLAQEHGGEIRLLITDVIMPEMNGMVLARSLQSLRPGLKSLFMSGYTANAIAHHGVLEDGICFIQKPFSLPDLATKVRQALEGDSAASTSTDVGTARTR